MLIRGDECYCSSLFYKERIRMKVNEKYIGHLYALLCVSVWGTTFITSKVLLDDFVPVQVALYRFGVAYMAIGFMSKGRMKWQGLKGEVLFLLAGLMGVTLYLLAENSALTYTTAANVSVIISATPFLTGIVSWLFFKGEKISVQFCMGFALAVGGICLISYNGASQLSLNPLGDLLTVVAALCWAFYCNILILISKKKEPILQTTRRIFFYGVITLLPASFFFDANWTITVFRDKPSVILSFLYLGVLASAICFVSWSKAVEKLGAKRAAQYIYLNPIITLIASAIILSEPTNATTYIGVTLTLGGLILSSRK